MNARSVYLIILPIVKASRNFLTGYCMAPAPNRNGGMGTGGGSRAGIAIAPKPQRSNLLYTLSKLLGGNLRVRVSFPLTIVGHIPPDTLSIARTALRDRNPYVRLRDQMGSIFDDGMFAHLGRFRSPNYSHAAIARRDGHQ